MPKVSIVVPIYNEGKYIDEFLESIVRSDYNKEDMEIILVDGGSSDETIDVVKLYMEKYPFIRLLRNHRKIVPVAMNMGIKSAKGEYIIRLDAHSVYPKDYFSKLIYYHEKLNADNVGGVITTDVRYKTRTSNAIKNVLSDRLGVGSFFRSGVDEIKEVDTVPFGCYKREVFKKIGFYNEKLVRNQDIELNKRLKKAGGKIYLIPEIKIIYYARETFKDLMKNSFENGKWNILTVYYTRTLSSLSFRHFIPMIFVLSLVVLLTLGAISELFLHFLCVVFGIYISVVSFRSLKIKRDTSFFHQIAAFILLHFSYGIGSIIGLLMVLMRMCKK